MSEFKDDRSIDRWECLAGFLMNMNGHRRVRGHSFIPSSSRPSPTLGYCLQYPVIFPTIIVVKSKHVALLRPAHLKLPSSLGMLDGPATPILSRHLKQQAS